MSNAPKKIPTRRLGRNGPYVSAVGLGAMGITTGASFWYGKVDVKAATEALTYAADRGVTFWDTADVYGDSEVALGNWFKETGRRSEIFLATKFGSYDPEGKVGGGKQVSTPSYVKYALQRSLKRLGVDYIDLYYQHRVDPKVPIEVTLEALREPLERGQIKWIGLSEVSVETLKRAKAVNGVGEKIIAVQMEFSPYELSIEKNGFTETAKEVGVSVVAYSPLGRGMASGAFRSRSQFDEGDIRLWMPRFSEENFTKNLELTDKLKAIAERLNSTSSQVALAWILAEHENFVPIPGCRTAERVEENAGAAELQLSPEDVKAIREVCEEADVQGTRTPESFSWLMVQDTIPLEKWKGE